MVLLGAGAGVSLPGADDAGDVGRHAEDAGLASGLVNTTAQVGGALGLAVLATLAADAHRRLLARRRPAAAALNGGYHLAYLVGAALMAVAVAIAVVAIEPDPPRPAPRRRPRSAPRRARAPTAAAARRPARAQVRAATRQANSRRRDERVEASPGRSRASPRARHQARKPPPNASPAPIVSTTSTRGAGTATSRRRA